LFLHTNPNKEEGGILGWLNSIFLVLFSIQLYARRGKRACVDRLLAPLNKISRITLRGQTTPIIGIFRAKQCCLSLFRMASDMRADIRSSKGRCCEFFAARIPNATH
jgi:hypothetical protein